MNAHSGNFGKSALCRAFGINRSSIYYKRDGQKKLAALARHEKDLQDVRTAFEKSRNNYGARQIKTALAEKGNIMSRRKIRRLMEESGLESSYRKPKYVKPGTKKADCNKADISNLLGRDFSGWNEKEVLVSDLTYVKVDGKWCYICVLIDLFNREVVGWSVGENKTAEFLNLIYETQNQKILLIKDFLATDKRSKELVIKKEFEHVKRNKAFWVRLRRPFDPNNLKTICTEIINL